jgi:hypothetical protein
VAREWFAKFPPRWVPSHADKIIRRLERHVFPWIGSEPVGEVTAPKLLTTTVQTTRLLSRRRVTGIDRFPKCAWRA